LAATPTITLNGGSGRSGAGALIADSSDGTFGGNVVLAAPSSIGGNNANLTLSGVISGTFDLTINPAHFFATVTLTNTANTYTGSTTVVGGTLVVASLANAGTNSSLGKPTGSTADITLGTGTNSATLIDTNAGGDSTNRTIRVNGTGGGTLQNNSGTLTLSGNIVTDISKSITFNTNGGNITQLATPGIISGAGNVNVSGTGILSLSGTNTYTGTTTINSGATLSALVTNALSDATGGAITVNSGGELSLNLGGATLANTNTITLNGTGVGGAGALYEAGSSGTDV